MAPKSTRTNARTITAEETGKSTGEWDPLAAWFEFEDVVTTDRANLKDDVAVGQTGPDGRSAGGAPIGSLKLDPVDTLPARLHERWPHVKAWQVQTRSRAGLLSHNVRVINPSPLEQPQVVHTTPIAPPAAEAVPAWAQRLAERMDRYEAGSPVAGPRPDTNVETVFAIFNKAGDLLKGFMPPTTVAAAAAGRTEVIEPTEVLDRGIALGRQLSGQADTMLELLKPVMPAVGELVQAIAIKLVGSMDKPEPAPAPAAAPPVEAKAS